MPVIRNQVPKMKSPARVLRGWVTRDVAKLYHGGRITSFHFGKKPVLEFGFWATRGVSRQVAPRQLRLKIGEIRRVKIVLER